MFLMFITDPDRRASWLILTSAAALILMHAIFWTITQPVNKYWLRSQRLTKLGRRFFSTPKTISAGEPDADDTDWTVMRYRWEYSHVARAILALIALVTLSAGLLVR